MEQIGGRPLVWYSSVLMAGFAGGFVGNLSTGLLFLIIGETLFYFLSLCFASLLAALCAVLAGNAMARDGRKARLWPIVCVSQVAAILAAVANVAFVLYVLDNSSFAQVGLGQQMTLSTIAISLVSVIATWGLRRPSSGPSDGLHRDGRSAGLLILLALLLLIMGVAVDGMSGPVA